MHTSCVYNRQTRAGVGVGAAAAAILLAPKSLVVLAYTCHCARTLKSLAVVHTYTSHWRCTHAHSGVNGHARIRKEGRQQLASSLDASVPTDGLPVCFCSRPPLDDIPTSLLLPVCLFASLRNLSASNGPPVSRVILYDHAAWNPDSLQSKGA